MVRIIGISGKKGSGKSTAAAYLHRFGFQELAFAEPLKEACMLIFSLRRENVFGSQTAKEQYDEFWQTTPRQILQRVGVAIRGLSAPLNNVWIRALQRRIERILDANPNALVVVSDVRYADEAQMLRDLGAKIISIERPTCYGDLDMHESENQVIIADINIMNVSTLAAFQNQVLQVWMDWGYQ